MEKDMDQLDAALSRLKETIRQQLLRELKGAEEALYQAEYDDFAYTNGTYDRARKMVIEARKKLEELGE
jgi:hypothetical protein